MGELERADVEVVGGELDELSALALADADKTRRRNVEILQEYAARPKTGKPITVRFRFLASPVELLADEHGHVRAVRVENNAIVARDDGSLAARGTRDVRRDTGAARVPLDRLHRPADRRRPVRRAARPDSQRGRSRDRCDGDRHQLGEYVSGWIKRGPSGVIGTNKKDSQDTVTKIVEDVAAGRFNQPDLGRHRRARRTRARRTR